jgi:hypothetical protein
LLVALLAATATATPSKDEFQDAMRSGAEDSSRYCKKWCVAWGDAHPDNHGCQAADGGGVPIPPPSNPKRDKKHGVHRKYCKKACTSDLCGIAGEAVGDEGVAVESSGDDESGGGGGGGGGYSAPAATRASSSNEPHCALACTIDPPTNLKALGALKKAIHTAKLNEKSSLSLDADKTAAATSAAVEQAEESVAAAGENLSAAEDDQTSAISSANTAKASAKVAGEEAARLEEEASMLKKMQQDALAKVDELAHQGFFSRAKKIISHSWSSKSFQITADLDEELETTQSATQISKAADSRKTQAEGALAKAGSAASESVKAQRRAIAAAANAHAAKLSAEDATNILTGAKEGASAAQKDATRALGEMASAKSKLLRGMFKNAVSRVAQKVSIDKKVADCTQKCTAILDAIEGAEPYTMNVLRAVSLGFGVQGGN